MRQPEFFYQFHSLKFAKNLQRLNSRYEHFNIDDKDVTQATFLAAKVALPVN